MYDVQLTPAADRGLDDAPQRAELADAIRDVASHRNPLQSRRDVIRLDVNADADLYRLRHHDYRVILALSSPTLAVLDVGKRDARTYNDLDRYAAIAETAL